VEQEHVGRPVSVQVGSFSFTWSENLPVIASNDVDQVQTINLWCSNNTACADGEEPRDCGVKPECLNIVGAHGEAGEECAGYWLTWVRCRLRFAFC
jgi:hypothetical protein